MENNYKIKPLFKYIGGKSWLRNELRAAMLKVLSNKSIDTYVEPFTGGLGSFLSVYDLLLSHNVKNIVLSDINECLIFTYNSILFNKDSLIDEFLKIEMEFANVVDKNWKSQVDKVQMKLLLKDSAIFFNNIKKDFNKNKNNVDVKQSARLIFLQKHSFNGIYRENSKGDYNTPFNWSGNNMLETFEGKVNELHNLFKMFNLKFVAQSFENISYNSNALYYLDPPYINEEQDENKYNKEMFDLDKQILLIEKIKNVDFIYSNHKSKKLIEEFKNINNIFIKEVARKNIMSAKASSRNEDKIEMLVCSFK